MFVLQNFLEHYARFEKQLNNATDGNVRAFVAAVKEQGAADNPQAAFSLTSAIVCAILVLPSSSSDMAGSSSPSYRETLLSAHMMAVPDSTPLLAQVIKPLCGDPFSRLQNSARDQLLWIYSELFRRHAAEVENLTAYILRNIITGNLSSSNQALIQQIVTILTTNMFVVSFNTNSSMHVVLQSLYLMI